MFSKSIIYLVYWELLPRLYLKVMIADKSLHHGHPIGGESACLVGADGGRVTLTNRILATRDKVRVSGLFFTAIRS